MSEGKNMPLHKFRLGKASVTVWENEGAGNNRPYKTYQLDKNYMDAKDKQWKKTNSYTRSELYDQLTCIQKALENETKDQTEQTEEE